MIRVVPRDQTRADFVGSRLAHGLGPCEVGYISKSDRRIDAVAPEISTLNKVAFQRRPGGVQWPVSSGHRRVT